MPLFIEITHHAVDQIRARFPVETGRLADSDVRRLIVTEVADAMREHRMATKLPRFAVGAHDRRARAWRGNRERARSMRFLWTDDEGRVYLVNRLRQRAVVVTVIRAGAADTPADVAA